jgi:ABC-2 type transport system permease protein
MSRLVRAELLKLSTTRTGPVVLLGMLALTAGWTAYTILRSGVNGAPSLGTTASTLSILTTPRVSSLLMLLFGVVLTTTEFRHRTATAAFLVTPRRGRVIGAKLVAVTLVGGGYAVVAFAAVIGVALPWLALYDVPLQMPHQNVLLAVAGTLFAIPLYGLVGVAVGTLIRNQLAAVVVALAWLQLIEPQFLDQFLPGLVRWLLTGASAALSRAEVIDSQPQWLGAALLLGYALLLAAAGNRLVLRRDLTG